MAVARDTQFLSANNKTGLARQINPRGDNSARDVGHGARGQEGAAPRQIAGARPARIAAPFFAHVVEGHHVIGHVSYIQANGAAATSAYAPQKTRRLTE
jgi:hypothetical protein